MNLLKYILEVVLHLDKYLEMIVFYFGYKAYLIMFTIIFLETGFIFTPFLPGNSLMIVAGTLASINIVNIYLLVISLILASILGGIVNYHIGKLLGVKILKSNLGKIIIKKNYLETTKEFYEKQGGRTLIIARYIPVVRTFSPFIAGISEMKYSKFMIYNIIGAIMWIMPLVFGGYIFGNLEIIKENYFLIIFIPILIYSFSILGSLLKNKIKKIT